MFNIGPSARSLSVVTSVAAPTFKRGYGFHPLRGRRSRARPARVSRWRFLLRPDSAGSNTAADHKAGLADTAGGTHEFVHHLHVRRLQYSVGFQVTAARPGPVARGRRRSYGVKRLFVIQSALTMVRSAPRWGSERFGSG